MAACVQPGQYLINRLTFFLKHYNSIRYLSAMLSAKFRKIRIQNTRHYLRAVFRDSCIYSKSHMSLGGTAQMCSAKFLTILIQNGWLRAILTSKWCNSVSPARYLTNHLKIVLEHCIHIYLLPQCHVFSKVSENQNSKYQIWSSFYEVLKFLKKVMSVGEVLPKFSIFLNLFPNYVPCALQVSEN